MRDWLHWLIIPFLLVLTGCQLSPPQPNPERVRDAMLLMKDFGDDRLRLACKEKGVDIRQFNRPPVFAWPQRELFFEMDVLYCSNQYHFFLSHSFLDNSSERNGVLLPVKPETPCDIRRYGEYRGRSFNNIDTAVAYYGRFKYLFPPY